MILEQERQNADGSFNGEAFVKGVIDNLETCDLSAREKALFRFVDKVNHDSPRIAAEDIEALHALGWDDASLYYALTVCALFNFYNRWVDASGVHALSDETHRAGGRRSAKTGYVRE